MTNNNKPAPKYTQEQKVAIIKASNEMLGDAIEHLKERGVSQDIIDAVKESIQENKDYAQANYGASEEDIQKARYHGANISEIKAYEDRLRMRGLTDEAVRRKAVVVATAGGEKTPDKSERTVEGMGFTKADGSTVSEDEFNEKEGDAKKKRRARRKRETGEKEPVHTRAYVETAEPEPVRVEIMEEKPVVAPPKQKAGKKKATVKENDMKNYSVEQFNLDDIPDYVQYDIIPLPSNGQCYKHKKGRIPVAYLTAADENIIASPNMYRDGKLLDVILRRKVLDKSINVDELCAGDRDAIIIWLRATAYGDEFPINAVNRETGKSYETIVPLSSLKYHELDLKGDENGLLTFKTSNGDEIKFRYLSSGKEREMRNVIAEEVSDYNRFSILNDIQDIRQNILKVTLDDEDTEHIAEDIEEIEEILTSKGDLIDEQQDGDIYPTIITTQLYEHTVSVNGNTDRDYIKGFVNNMRAGVAKEYREFLLEHRPGVDMNITVNIPESDGGGSFETFLRIDDSVFINI